MEFNEIVERARSVREQYQKYEHQQYGREWTREELALGFVGDIGDLVKLVQAKAGVRNIPDADEKLAHELADCLWSVIALADVYEVDLEQAFLNTMDDFEQGLNEKIE
tara:strand:+ start:101 stop:424 length:324 start_codon:yes stop_codon:yes gene_type:complete